MSRQFPYDLFIVQSLIGNYSWSSGVDAGKLYHVGTMPNQKNRSYVADIRMMVGSNMEQGLRPLAIYGRRARAPLTDQLQDSRDSWEILGTNLTTRMPDGSFETDTSRLLMMDSRDFNKLGIGVDDLIEGFIQTILAMIAIDKMAQTLLNQKGKLKSRLFRSLNNDDALIREIMTE
jgi:hypothetical protein